MPKDDLRVLGSSVAKTSPEAIATPQAATSGTGATPVSLEEVLGSWRQQIVGWLVVHLARPVLFLARRFRVVRLGSTYLVTRFDDVQEVLARDDAFRTPFGKKAKLLGWQPSFLLAQQDGADYQAVKRDVYALFRATGDDAADLDNVKTWSYDEARQILANAAPGSGNTRQIDAIRDLIGRVPTRIIKKYYGLSTLGNATDAELRQFEDHLVIVSSYMFANADEPDSASTPHAKYAVRAAKEIRAEIKASIAVAKNELNGGRDDVLMRMLRNNTQEPDPNNPGRTKRRFDDDRIISYLFAMSLGFMPTNLMANGNMLEILLSRPAVLEQARDAARTGDDDKLKNILFEAMRFRPLNPGPWRRANADFLLGADGEHPRLIRKGAVVWASTQSAMFDSARVHAPRRFDRDRSTYVYMLYGFGLHYCIGKPIADVQITQTMKALLELPGLRRVTRLKRISMFPRRLMVSY